MLRNDGARGGRGRLPRALSIPESAIDFVLLWHALMLETPTRVALGRLVGGTLRCFRRSSRNGARLVRPRGSAGRNGGRALTETGAATMSAKRFVRHGESSFSTERFPGCLHRV